MIKIYGIKNCDKVKRTLQILKDSGVNYQYHDYKKDGLSDTLIDDFLSSFSMDELINKRGTTWRALSEEDKGRALDRQDFKELIKSNTSLIKRPIMFHKNSYKIGLNSEMIKEV